LKSYRLERWSWGNRNLGKKGSTAKALDHVADAAPMGQSFDVTIYMYVGIVLER
jgi:hypothetical protein